MSCGRVLAIALFVLFSFVILNILEVRMLFNAPASNNDPGVSVYAPSNSTSNVAACLIVYNETLYLDEWLDFHIALGFSPIYIYDNSPDFELQTELYSGGLSWYDTRVHYWQHIQLIHFPLTPVQLAAYDRCIKQDASNSTFVALIDADEFLVLKKHNNVIDFMDHYCNFQCGQLSINWRQMGMSSERHYTPVPVLRRNVHGDSSPTIKVIVRPENVADDMRWLHSVSLKPGKLWIDTDNRRPDAPNLNIDGPTDAALLYHYPLKSFGELRYKTCVRGTSIHERGKTPFCDKPYYPLTNGTEFDDTAWRQLIRMVPKYRVYGEAVNVSF
jgi:hypothetical protein